LVTLKLLSTLTVTWVPSQARSDGGANPQLTCLN
jgi:hypothetical protein